MNIGIIGSGLIAKDFLSVHKKLDRLNVCAIYSRNFENAKKAAEPYDGLKVCESLDSMLLMKEIEFIYIAVPNHLHFEYAKKVLEAGKNVVLEKPFTVTSAEAYELFGIAKDKGLYLFEAITNLYIPALYEAESLIKRSGRIKTVNVSFTQRSSRYDDFKKGIIHPVFSAEMNGGVLMDLGVYNLHILNYLFGVPKEASYDKVIEKGVDVSGVIKLYYDGFTAESIISKTETTQNGIYIETDIGAVKCDGKPNSMEKVEICENGECSMYTSVGGADRLLAQWENFCDIYENQNYKKMLRMMEYTCGVCEIVDMLMQ